jgi:hypothetical protein
MTGPVYDVDLWLCAEDRATLAEAIRITNAQPRERVTPDDCNRCGGLHCDECSGPVDPYVPEYVRASLKRWKPTHADD